MRRRDWLRHAAASVALGAASSCSKPRRPRTIRVATTPLPEASGLHLAKELGYFDRAGLSVEITESPNVMQLITLLVAGQVDVNLTGLNPVFVNAVLQGNGSRIVAAAVTATAQCGEVGRIYALRRNFPKGLNDVRQLAGKSLGVGSVIGFSEFTVDFQLEHAGLAEDSVKIVRLPFGQAAAALLNGRVDALEILPESGRALAPVMNDLVGAPPFSAIYPALQHTFISFAPSMRDGDIETGKLFLDAYLRGARDFRAGKTPRFLTDLASKSGRDPSSVTGACRDSVVTDLKIDVENLDRFCRWAARKGYISRSADPSELIDSRFM